MPQNKIVLVLAFFCFSITGASFGAVGPEQRDDFLTKKSQPDYILVAKKKKRKKRKLRQRHLTGEARAKKNKTNIDFDAAAIDGERRLPMGTAINTNRPKHGHDLINLRLRWHPEMIQSTSNLETGRGR